LIRNPDHFDLDAEEDRLHHADLCDDHVEDLADLHDDHVEDLVDLHDNHVVLHDYHDGLADLHDNQVGLADLHDYHVGLADLHDDHEIILILRFLLLHRTLSIFEHFFPCFIPGFDCL